MKGKVAVFVREDKAGQLHKLARDQEHVELLPFTYEKTEEITELIERAFICDFYLFTEPITYLYIKDQLIRKKVPTIQVKFNEYTLSRAIQQLALAHNQALHRLSIDLPNRQPLDMILKDSDESHEDIYVYDYSEANPTTIEEIAAYHKQLWDEGQIDHVLTTSNDVKVMLEEANIRASTIEFSYSDLAAAVDETKSIITLDDHDSSQVVAGYVAIKAGYRANEDVLYELKAILTDFSKKTDTLLLETADQQFALFGTKGLLTHIRENYGTFPLLKRIKSAVDVPINLAFGLALKANQAQHHAQLALEKCQTEDESIAYVVNDREDILGPLGVKKHIDTSKLYQALIHKARLNNELSYNFINFIKDRNNEPFSSHDVASFYNVTKRSAERTVNKLLSGEVIKVSGEERPYQKGRPRKLFTLNI